MIAAFLEIHHDIEQGDGLGTSLIQLLKVPGQNPTIVLSVWMKHTLYEFICSSEGHSRQ